MNWHTALYLAEALLEEMGLDPLRVFALEGDLAEALIAFCEEALGNDQEIIHAIKHWTCRPKDETDLALWQTESRDWKRSCPHPGERVSEKVIFGC
jgi:hypothetical protein